MEWKIDIKRSALRKLKKIKDKKLSKILDDEINSLKKDPFKGKKLNGNYKKYRKIVISYKRAKDYRIVYEVIDNEVTIYIFDVGTKEGICYA